MSKKLKYPLILFFTILIAKLAYILIESYYNYHVLIITTSADISREMIEELNINGHKVSAIGITLLLLPFVYLIVRHKNLKKIYSTIGVSIIVLYLISYNMLNFAVDKIVELNKEKRYEAYYVNIFKYGLLNNIFSYDSFVKIDEESKTDLAVNERILLTNSFLLLHADENLIDKLQQRGKEKVADIYIKKYLQEDYNEKYNVIKDTSLQVSKSWDEFNEARKDLHIKLDELNNEDNIKEAHQKLITSLKEKYKEYKRACIEVEKNIKEKTTSNFIASTKRDLQKYFRYEKYQKAQIQYRESMIRNFGNFINPNKWKDSSGQLTDDSIKKVIIEEINLQAGKTFAELPKDLNAKQFVNNTYVKIDVANELKKNNILIPIDFDYSYSQFKKYFELSLMDENNEAPKKFYKELENKIGINDLKLDFTWNDFVNSNYIRNQIKKNAANFEDSYINNIIKIIDSKDLGNFKRLIYLPKAINEVDSMVYSKIDFEDGGKAQIHGDEAIKLLFIPPFALAVSMIALLLNSVTVLGMSLEYLGKSKLVVLISKSIFIIVILALPYILNFNSFDNEMIRQASTPQITNYLNFLNWISFYESINYMIHK